MVSKQAKQLYEFGPYRLDAAERLLRRDGEVVALPPRVFDTLLLLVENNGRLVSKDTMMSRLWPDALVEEATIARNISDLRKVLGEAPGGQKYIETVPRHGYRFVTAVRQLAEPETTLVVEKHTRSRIIAETADDTPATTSDGEAEPVKRKTRPALWLAVIVMAGLASALVYSLAPKHKESGRLSSVRSIAVLPFKPVGEQDSDEYLELGMADALITRLTGIKQIIVRPTGSVFKYHRAEQDALAAGRELGVDALLDGRLQKAGDHIRVTVQLIGVKDGTPLWADRFDAKSTDLFAVQDSISEQVTRALALNLTGDEQQRLTRRHTENPEAYQAYMKGRYWWNKRYREGFNKAIAYFNEAISLDPNYALAWAGLADCYVVLSPYFIAPPQESFPKAREAAARALQLDDRLAEAHTALAHATWMYDWDWVKAEAGFKRAIDLNPNYPTARGWYSVYLSAMGRHDEAIAEARRGQELDPLSTAIGHDVTRAFYHARQYDRAIAAYQKILELDPNHYRLNSWLELAYEQQGRYDQAVEARLKAFSVIKVGPETITALKEAYQSSGWRGFWRKELVMAEERTRQGFERPYHMARVYARLGESEKVFEQLEKAYAQHSDHLVMLKVDPLFDGLRSDPRFRDLLRRVGFTP